MLLVPRYYSCFVDISQSGESRNLQLLVSGGPLFVIVHRSNPCIINSHVCSNAYSLNMLKIFKLTKCSVSLYRQLYLLVIRNQLTRIIKISLVNTRYVLSVCYENQIRRIDYASRRRIEEYMPCVCVQ